jgi:hypothetical protein
VQEHVAELARRTHEREFKAELYKNLRGGIAPAAEGSPAADKPSPHLDREDRNQLSMLAQYNQNMVTATRAMIVGDWARAMRGLERCRVLETAVIPWAHMTAEQHAKYLKDMQEAADVENGVEGIKCGNPFCEHRITGGKYDKRRKGLCNRCYRYAAKWGVNRPLDLCEKDIERELEKEAG